MPQIIENDDERIVIETNESIDAFVERIDTACTDVFGQHQIDTIEVDAAGRNESFDEFSPDVVGILKKQMDYSDDEVRFRVKSDGLGVNLTLHLFPAGADVQDADIGPSEIDGLATDSMTVVAENHVGGKLTEDGKKMLLRLAEA
ncbi:MAG: hypothetical protein MUP66_00775 [Candidatus Nanohaloarchaeota archaeon QJJ-5]|nr:hypothetical protein [Candidatus Nanohaloarchaeota archaeon QJJ-5]